MEKNRCNVFDEVKDFDVIEVRVEECEATHDKEGRVVVERIITIKAEKTSRGDYKSKKITIPLVIGAIVTLVGLLADIPSAAGFISGFLP